MMEPILTLNKDATAEEPLGTLIADCVATFVKTNGDKKEELAKVEKALIPVAEWIVKNRPKGK